MLMPASSEFVALCRAQIALLTQGLGASLSTIYLSQEVGGGAEPQLIPIATYPEDVMEWKAEWVASLFPLAESAAVPPNSPRLLAGADLDGKPSELHRMPAQAAPELPGTRQNSAQVPRQTPALVPQRQIVLPLLHEDVVLGLLVVARDDRAWSEWEQTQVQHISTTLSLACLLDQRSQWLEQDRRQQRQLQRRQQDLFDNLLHQFRNSLTILQTFGKLLLKRLLPGDNNRNIATSIVQETTRLKELSQHLELTAQLHLEEPEAPLPLIPAPEVPLETLREHESDTLLPGSPSTPQTMPSLSDAVLTGVALPLERCAVKAVLDPLLDAATAIAQDRNLVLARSIPTVLPEVWANPPALREVLNNLLENALKYTPAGGQIWVQVNSPAPLHTFPSPNWLEIRISDTGPGIPPQDLPHIFERRYRGIQAESDIPGSGLGLAIARTLVQQMSGEIEVISPAERGHNQAARPNQSAGTTFVVRLAIAPTASIIGHR
jgi:signal transduction histidine kinase